MPFVSKVPDEKEENKYYIGYPKGVNNVQDKTLIDDKSLILGENIMLVIDGVTRRFGTTKPFDEGSASKVYGSKMFFNKSTDTKKWVRIANNRLQYLNSTTWTNVSSQAYTNTQTRFVQTSNKIFIYNGVDNLTYYDGSSITTYTALAALTGLAVTPTGTTGSTTYSYRVQAFNTTGEGAACAAVTTATGNATLSTTNYNALSWNAVSGATGYNVYGRTATGYGEAYLATVYTNSYNDTGDDAPATTKLPGEDDTTAGIIAKMAVLASGRQFAAGVTEGSTYYPTRLYYSGTLNNIDTFNSSELGGGWVEVYENDGGEIVDLKPYSNGILVFKTNGIFRFYFTDSGLPALQEITRAIGGVNFEASQAVDNDVIFVGQKENRIAVYTLGFQANYSTQIRTNELSIFIADGLTGVNRIYLNNIASFYYGNRYGFTYTSGTDTENSEGWVIDTSFGGWVNWTGLPMQVTQYDIYDDGSTAELYGSSNHDGYMIKLNQTARNDNGSAFTSRIGTKFFNMGFFDVDKIFRNPVLWFKYLAGGNLSVELYVDGVQKVGTATLSTTSGGAGFGLDLFGSPLFGSNYGTPNETTVLADISRELTTLQIARSLGIYLTDTEYNSNWLFMGLHVTYSNLLGKPLDQEEKVIII